MSKTEEPDDILEPKSNSQTGNVEFGLEFGDKIGQGFYADVWRATDLNLNRKVAVKVLRSSSPRNADILMQARALAKAQHPNVVIVYSVTKVTPPGGRESVDGIIMELIEGETLKSRLANGEPFECREAISYGNSLVDGMEHIHSVELFHNDLHSENVLINNSQIKIIDILSTSSLIASTTRTKDDRVRHEIRDLTGLLFEIASKSKFSQRAIKEFGLALQDSRATFEQIRMALQQLESENQLNVAPQSLEDVSKLEYLKNAIEHDHPNVDNLLSDYLTSFTNGLSDYAINIKDSSPSLEEKVFLSFERMTSCRNDFISLIVHICKSSRRIDKYKDEIFEFLQRIAGYIEYRIPNISYFNRQWNDNFRLFLHELFIYMAAVLIKFRKYSLLHDLTHEGYYLEHHRGRGGAGFVQLREHAASVEIRAHALNLRQTSPIGTLFRDRVDRAELPFEDLMQADFVLFLISLLDGQPGQRIWFPVTLIYGIYRPPFRIFEEATVRRYFNQICILFGVRSKAELLDKYGRAILNHKLSNGSFEIADAEFISIPKLANLDRLDSQ